MLAENLIGFFEDWAPPGAAWEKDNVGLQVGSGKRRVQNIFLCLELNGKVLNEALKKKADFIFTHHPLIFKPINRIDTLSDPKSKLIELLIKNDIVVYSAHTNLDFTKDGVSFELARVLGVKEPEFLVKESSNQFKLVAFIPEKNVEEVSEKIFEAGAGIIGEYEKCSFSMQGVGSFLGSEFSNPSLGKKQRFEKVEETRLEVLVDSWKLNRVTNALKKAHPYEEPAFDIYPLKNDNVNFGFGAIGELENDMKINDFLSHVCRSLKTGNLRYTVGKKKNIKRVAVCGGSGADLLIPAIKNNADAFVTADIKYHPFQDAEDKILFVDAGHYETEIHSLNAVKRKLEKYIKFKGEPVKITKYSGSTNPIKFFNNKGVK